MSSPQSWPSRTPEGFRALQLVYFFLALLAVLASVANYFEIQHLPAVRRGCVQVEFSNDGKDWTASAGDYPILRLHNVCSGTAVRLDEPEDTR